MGRSDSIDGMPVPSGAGTSTASTKDLLVGGKVPAPAVGRAGGELSERLMQSRVRKKNREKGKRIEKERATGNTRRFGS